MYILRFLLCTMASKSSRRGAQLEGSQIREKWRAQRWRGTGPLCPRVFPYRLHRLAFTGRSFKATHVYCKGLQGSDVDHSYPRPDLIPILSCVGGAAFKHRDKASQGACRNDLYRGIDHWFVYQYGYNKKTQMQ
jgi:hypothetical protein